MQLTTLRKDGRIELPTEVRNDIAVGTVFEVRRGKKAILLKKVKLTPKEEQEQQELDEMWRDIDEGKGVTMTVEEFRKEMASW